MVVEVACAILRLGDEICAYRRAPGRSLEGFWEFPGGKLEDDEDPWYAIERELNEELSISPEIRQYLGVFPFDYPQGFIKLHAFLADVRHLPPPGTDHDMAISGSPEELLSTLKWSPADIPVLESYIARQSGETE